VAIDAGALDALLRAELERWGVPGAVVGVLHGGEEAVLPYGVTSLASGELVSEETPFRVASLTKPLTATLTALLSTDGLLGLDDPVKRVVPELLLADEAVQETVTTRQLLAHLSGLDCETPHDLANHGDGDDALAAAIATYPTLGQLTRPGEIWSYANTGYWLAGHAIARAAGAPYEKAAAELVLTPLGMSDSRFVHDGCPPAGAALGHTPRAGAAGHDVIPGYPFARARAPSGGLVSTVPDLLRFAAEQIASPELASLHEPVVEAVGRQWGTGWALEPIDGVQVAEHSGSYGGFQSQLTIVPDRRLAVVVLTNSGRGSAAARRVVEWALEACCGLRRPEPTRLTVDLAPFEGLYRAGELTVEVQARDARLRATQRLVLPGGGEAAPPPLDGVAVAPTRFAVTDGEARGAQFDFPGPDRVRVGGRLALRAR
jgi:CubicO group peptidase (beta-lactamase class C family)